MKALVYTAPNRMMYENVEHPTLLPDEVIIKNSFVGICGSDMHAYHGHDPRRNPGLIMGHELAGVVHESASTLFSVGDRVTINPLIVCGYCDNCLQGRDNLCSNRTMVGMTRPGAYADYMSIPAKCLIPLTQSISFEHAALTEPAATVIHALNLSMKTMQRPLPELKSLVIGGGAIGFLMALLMRSYGCRDITIAETNPLRRENIAKYLDCSFINPLKESIQENGYNYAVDAVGCEATRNLCIKALKPGSTFMHIGLQDWETVIDMRKITLAELTLLGTYCYTHADLHAAMHALDEGVFGSLDWVDIHSMKDGARIFEELSKGKLATPKIILFPEI